MSKRDKITLAVFVFVSLMAGSFGYWMDQILTDQPEGNSLGMGLWLVLPFLTSVVMRIINKNMKEMGFRLCFRGNGKWYAVAFWVFPGITLLCSLIAWITGGLIMGDVEVVALIALMLSTFLASCIQSIFEEIAWRGCLVPYLVKTGMNDWYIYFLSGLVWGMWHITYYLYFLPEEYFVDTSRGMMVVSGIVIMVLWSPLFVELRRVTDSVWPCVLLHSMQGAVPTLLFVTEKVLRMEERHSFMLNPVSGILQPAVIFALGLQLRKYRLKHQVDKVKYMEVEQ